MGKRIMNGIDALKLASLYFLVAVKGRTPRDALTYLDDMEVVVGTALDHAKDSYTVPEDLNIEGWLMSYLCIDYEQIVYDFRAEGVWSEFEFVGMPLTCVNANFH